MFPTAKWLANRSVLKMTHSRVLAWLCSSAVVVPLLASPVAARRDPCKGLRPCDLGGDFTINEMIRRPPHRISGMCASRCFWEAVVTNSCFEPDAVVEIHAPVSARTGRLHRLAAEILVSEIKPPTLQQFLRATGAGYRLKFTRLTGRELISHGAQACQ